jgi:UDP-N-acetylmuramyl tripeptide synthase
MAKKITDLLMGIADPHILANKGQEITGIASDSRKVKPGFLFVALGISIRWA